MRLVISIFIILSLSIAKMPEAKYKLKMTTIKKEACKELQKDKLCYTISLKYPLTEILRKDIAQILQKNIKNTKYNLFKDDPYLEIENIKDEDTIVDNNWFSNNTLELFDYYKDFSTISIFSIDYLGGAHPNSFLELYPVNTKTSKRVTIHDIISNDKIDIFYLIAQRAYKIYVGLLPNEPLTKDGWFEDSFILSKNFAITQEGLLFSYSPYEIKSYADGYTYFILPYYMLRDIIDKDSIIYDIVKSNKLSKQILKVDKKLEFIDEKGELHTIFKYIGHHKFELDISANLTNNYKNLWLSIGVPQYRDGKGIYIVDYKGLDRFSIYPAKSRIFNIEQRRAIRSKYLLIEGSKKRYELYSNISAKIILKTPIHLDSICVEVRLSAKNRKIESFLNDGFEDQQGFLSKRLCLPNPTDSNI